MDEAAKKQIAASMWATMTELKREEEELQSRALGITSTLASMAQTWEALELGPLPKDKFFLVSEGRCEVGTAVPANFDEDAGMTERIRAILMANSDKYLFPTEIRDALVKTGLSLEGRSNPLAEVHIVLKRLAEKKNSRIITSEWQGKISYGYQDKVPTQKKGA